MTAGQPRLSPDQPSVSHRRSTLAWWAVAVGAMALDLLLWGGNTATRGGGSVAAPVIYAVAVAMTATLATVTQRPMATYVAAWAYTIGWGLLLPTYEPFTALLVATYYLARHFPAHQARWFALGTTAPWAVNTVNAALLTHADAASIAVTGFIWCVLTGMAWMAGTYGYRTQELMQLREVTLRAEASLSAQQERLRMARELHDIVAHSVSAIIFQAAGAQHVMHHDDPQVLRVLRTIETTGTQAMRELRRLLGFLLTPDLDDVHLIDSTASLRSLDSLLETTRACSVDVRFAERGDRRVLAPRADHAAYRVVQESLANAIRHGGPGSTAEVSLAWEPDHLQLVVNSRSGSQPTSDGATEHSGHGLDGLRARMYDLGGTFDSDATGDGGFLVSAQVPYDSVPDHRS